MKGFLFCIFLSIYMSHVTAQNVSSFWIGFSPTAQTTKETRYTSTFRSGLGYVGTLGYSNLNDKRNIFAEAEFTSTIIGRQNISNSRNLQPNLQISYTFQRPDKINFGPDLQLGTLLQFRNGKSASNNRISYVIWNSLGISANRPFSIGSVPMIIHGSLPIISYVIRPSYSFPFTDRFLEQENYNLGLNDLRENIVRGGKIRTLNSFVNLKLGIEAYHFLTKNFGGSLKYQFSYLAYLKQKSLYQFTHQFIFTFMLNNSK